jgi:parallel beta-helix repeat protein
MYNSVPRVLQALFSLNVFSPIACRSCQLLCAALIPALLLSGCGGGSALLPGQSGPQIAISPNSAVVDAGSTRQYTATVTGSSSQAVNWMVNNTLGGNSTVGTISATGLFTAPASLQTSSSQTETITAVNSADPTDSASVPVTLVPKGSGVSVSISPTSATVQAGLTQQFAATVTGSSDTAVTWRVNNIQGGSSSLGTVSSTGLYTAPAAPPASGSITVTAVSAADSSRSASATVKVTSSPGTVSVSIAPTSVTVQAGLTQQFAATVTGTSNTAVSWSVNQIQGENSTYGTISSTGLFTAPASVPANPSVSIKATSYQDSTKFAVATAVIAPPVTTGSNYYVAPSGSDSNDGSASHPWATIHKAASLAQPGWIIHVAPGVYSGPITTSSSGNSSSHIRYISDTQWGAIIRCASGTSCAQVWIQNGNYVDVLGFDITSLNTATQEGLMWYGTYGLIRGNKVHDIGCVGAGSNGGAAINTRSTATHTTIDSNMAYNVGIGTGYNTVHGIYINSTQYVTVSNNLAFHNEVWGILFHHGTGSYYATVVNNTVFDNAGGIIIEGKTSSYIANNILAYNTRVTGVGTKYPLTECCQINTGTTNIYTNNLFYQNTYSTASFLDPAAVNAHPVFGNPAFVRYTGDETGDYHIQTGPAVDAGASTYAPVTDFDGGRRPVGSFWDIGAYEFGSAPASWPW